jgi:hypothetical protein
MSSVNGFFARKRPPREKPLWRRARHWDGRLGIPRLWSDELWALPTKGGLVGTRQGKDFLAVANKARAIAREAKRNA